MNRTGARWGSGSPSATPGLSTKKGTAIESMSAQRLTSVRRLIDRVDKPEYLFSLRAVSQRLKLSGNRLKGEVVNARLSWGVPITVDRAEVIGYSILAMGVYDLSVTEVLVRLASPGETCIDAGANIGQMCSIMALRVGSAGRVIAFEPYSRMYERLSKNVHMWHMTSNIAAIDLRKQALSSEVGKGTLSIPNNIARNGGLASLVATSNDRNEKEDVSLTTLDATIENSKVAVLKLDVEGHELAVLRGCVRALEQHRIRDIVFEEYRPFPSDAHRMLSGYGYHIFRISRTLFGPTLKEANYRSDRFRDALPNYLATLDAERAMSLIRPRKWMALTKFWAPAFLERSESAALL